MLSARKIQVILAALFAAGLAPLASAAWGDLNMPVGVTELSREIYYLHQLILWVCVVIAIAVFSVMIYSIVKFRKSQGAVPDTKMLHSTRVEIVWTVVPVLILVAMAIPAARGLMNIEDSRNVEMNVKVTGYQWKWQYEYMESGVSFFSNLDSASNAARQLQSGVDPNSVPNYLLSVDRPLVIPVGTKVRLLLTAQDVIHSWWVPDFGMKKDAIPGFMNEMWIRVDEDKPGVYRGQCAELCGRDHGFMPIVVEVKSKADFATWLAAQQAADQPPAEIAPAIVDAEQVATPNSVTTPTAG
ncbi:MAG: cytochrome c oxidase subunit II [Proteobacteria bacterium]|nr:cytochrome c oxidase subunit II [Pseudomonadota bacterium]